MFAQLYTIQQRKYQKCKKKLSVLIFAEDLLKRTDMNGKIEMDESYTFFAVRREKWVAMLLQAIGGKMALLLL